MRNFIFLKLFLILFILSSCDNNTELLIIKDYYIECDKNLFNEIYKNYKKNIYADVILKKGGKKAKAKLRIRGDSSRDFEKKSLKIKIEDPNSIYSKKTFNFNAEYTDQTFLRSYLSSSIFKKMDYPCFSTTFSNIYLNNKYYGLYLEVENIDKDFLIKNGFNKKGDLYKASIDGACLYDTNEVKIKWEKKTNKNSCSKSLTKLINDLKNTDNDDFYSYIKENFNYSKLIDYLAINAFIANGSTYYHNYYLYRDFNNGGKWILLPWDLDKTLSYYNWKPYKYHQTSSDWENDNPLIERCFQNRKIFSDFMQRINYIGEIINEDFYDSIYNNAIKNLEQIILRDSTGKIKNIQKWKKHINNDKNFLNERSKNLIKDISLTPTGFKIHKLPHEISLPFKISWDTSHNSEEYEIWISKDFLYPDSITYKFITKNNSYWIDSLPLGSYYWKVIAKNKYSHNTGFNSKNNFNLKQGTVLDERIFKKTVLIKKNSPYRVIGDLIIDPSANIVIEKGVTILMEEESKINCKANFRANGTKNSPINILPIEPNKSFHSINFFKCDVNIKHVNIKDGLINSKNSNFKIDSSNFTIKNRQMEFGDKRPAIIWVWRGSATINNISLKGNSKGEGINISYSNSKIINSKFYNTPDAIELINVNNGIISNNLVVSSPDDAIDLNGCLNIEISNNFLINNIDKGISIGTDWGNKFVSFKPGFNSNSSNINVFNNYISGNNIGICIKDSSFVCSKNNIISHNNLGLKIYRKNKKYMLGGTIKSVNDEISCNNVQVEVDMYSQKSLNNTIDSCSVIKILNNFIFTSLMEWSINDENLFIKNNSGVDINLNGLVIVNRNNEDLFTFHENHNIESGGEICITNNKNILKSNYFYSRKLKTNQLKKIYFKNNKNKLFHINNEKDYF